MSCKLCSCSKYPRLPFQLPEKQRTYKAPIMIIGESPTASETRNNNNSMTGSGAQVLRQTMSAVGLPIDQSTTYWTTAIKCAVPKKKGSKFPKDAPGNCHKHLIEEIKAVSPRLILVCGATALITLTNNPAIKITTEYGRVKEYDFLPGIQVIPIMNPGVLLHKPNDYKPFLTMLQLAAKVYKGESMVDTGETTWTVVDTPDKCKALWQLMHTKAASMETPLYVGTDMETTSLDYRIAEFLVLGLSFEKNHTYVIPRSMRHLVHNFLEGDLPWRNVWAFGKYDKKVLWRRNLANPELHEDITYQHYVLDETSAHDLGYLSKVYLNAEEYKYKMNQNWKAITLDTYEEYFDALCERVAVDCDYQRQLCLGFNTILNQPENLTLKKLYGDFLMPASNFLSRVEQNGILVNTKPLNEMDEKYQKLLASIMDEIAELASPFWDRQAYLEQTGAKSAPEIFNPGSSAQMSWMVYSKLKLKPRIRKGKGTDKDVLRSIQNPPKLITKVLEYRSVQKEHSTYVLGLLKALDEDNRVRTTFTLHVTATGRLSSKEPNVQNQPSANGVGNIRKAFIAPEDFLLAEIDYSGAELRWLAFYSKCPVLGQVFKEGRNLHHETAVALFGEHYNKKQKMRAKAVNFGIPYGITAPSIADEHKISVAEAQEMIDGWNRKYYGAAEYLEWCAKQPTEGKYLETLFGRRRRFGLVASSTLSGIENEAKNFPIQSSSSDLLLDCSMQMEKTLKETYNTLILNLIHDSDLLQIPAKLDILMAVGNYANRIMVQRPIELFDCPIPFKTDFEIGFNWGELFTFNWSTGKIEVENADDTITEINFYDWYNQQALLNERKPLL